jgi:hypothetical protein
MENPMENGEDDEERIDSLVEEANAIFKENERLRNGTNEAVRPEEPVKRGIGFGDVLFLAVAGVVAILMGFYFLVIGIIGWLVLHFVLPFFAKEKS